MSVDLQMTTLELIEVLEVQDGIFPFWRRFFPRQLNFTTAEIMFDVLTTGSRKLAPFVAPNVQGRMLKEKGFTTKTFRPAYVKPKHVVDPSRAIPRRPGEKPLGALSLQQRYDAIIANNLQEEKQQIENRLEWMAARAVIDGKVTIVGEDYPAVTVDFGRDASLTISLTGTARWGLLTADPLHDLEVYRRRVHKLAKSTITTLIFGLSAWAKFAANKKVIALLDKNTRGSDTTFNRAVPEGVPFEYRGKISGENGMGALELYTYSDYYEDHTGAEVDFLNENTVIGVGAGLQGIECFGAIMDKRAELQSLSMFPKIWDEEDPSVTYTMTQSAPLSVPTQPNASFTLNVGDATIES